MLLISKFCPIVNSRVVYLTCQECDDRVCEKSQKPQVTILPKKSKTVHDVSYDSNAAPNPVQEPQKERESVSEKCPDCSTCFNRLEEYDDRMFGNAVKVTRCKVLTNQLVFRGQVAIVGCDYHNKDMSKEKICLNCEHFLGMGDWGLSCKADYYKLPTSVSEACEKFKRKENND